MEATFILLSELYPAKARVPTVSLCKFATGISDGFVPFLSRDKTIVAPLLSSLFEEDRTKILSSMLVSITSGDAG